MEKARRVPAKLFRGGKHKKREGRLLRKRRVQARLRSQGDSCLTRLEVVNTVILGSLLGSRMREKIRGSIREPCCGSAGSQVLADQSASQAWSGHTEMATQHNTISTQQYTHVLLAPKPSGTETLHE